MLNRFKDFGVSNFDAKLVKVIDDIEKDASYIDTLGFKRLSTKLTKELNKLEKENEILRTNE